MKLYSCRRLIREAVNELILENGESIYGDRPSWTGTAVQIRQGQPYRNVLLLRNSEYEQAWKTRYLQCLSKLHP